MKVKKYIYQLKWPKYKFESPHTATHNTQLKKCHKYTKTKNVSVKEMNYNMNTQHTPTWNIYIKIQHTGDKASLDRCG